MSKKILKFDNAEVNKKKFHTSKQPIALDLVNADQILITDKLKHSHTGFKYFINYKDDIIRPLCTILPQTSGFIKYFDKGGKNISLMVEDDSVLFQYSDVSNKIKEFQGIKSHSNPIYDEKYIKAKVKEFNSVVNINFLGNEVPEEGVHYT